MLNLLRNENQLRTNILLSIFIFFSGLWNSQSIAQTKGMNLPLPRYVSLRAKEVYMRAGPGILFPVEWVYHRRFMPIEVVAEYDTWRKVRDWQGTQGWVHQSMLSNRRTFMVTNKIRTLRSKPNTKSTEVAKLEPGVIGRVLICEFGSTWCQVEVSDRKGWLRRVEFWGVYKNESVD